MWALWTLFISTTKALIMKWYQFPLQSQASEEGIVALGGDLSVDRLVSAYAQGIFPWPHEGYPLLWFCPWERGILFFDRLHIGRSLNKAIKKNPWRITIDQDFSGVILECSKIQRPNQNGTWISEEMIVSYSELHRRGYAHSVEVWENDQLIGGVYGVFVKNVFSAESMFYKKSNASKIAIYFLVQYLKSKGLVWMDVQMLTDITEYLGGELKTQKEYLTLLKESQQKLSIKW